MTSSVSQTGTASNSGQVYQNPPKSASPRVPIEPQDSYSRVVLKMAFEPIETPPEVHEPLQQLVDKLSSKSKLSVRPKVHILPQTNYQAREFLKKEIAANIGFLKHAKTPNEIAFVLAHELSHAHHGDSKLVWLARRGIPVVSLMALAGTVKGIQVFQRKKKKRRENPLLYLFALPVGIGVHLLLKRFHMHFRMKLSPKKELRCDQEAIRFLHQAGLSVEGFRTFLVFFSDKVKGLSWKEFNEGLRDTKTYGHNHPILENRMEALEKYLKENPHLASSQTAAMDDDTWRVFKEKVDSIFQQERDHLFETAPNEYILTDQDMEKWQSILSKQLKRH